MFVTGGQFYVFIACLAFGGVCGIFFSVSAIIKFVTTNKIIRLIPDLFAFLLTCALYVIYAFILNFPSFRAYMVIGVLLGIYLYLKSFHIILAKICKKAYNNIRKKFSRKNKSKHDRRKD